MGVMNGKNLFDVSGKVVLVTGAGPAWERAMPRPLGRRAPR